MAPNVPDRRVIVTTKVETPGRQKIEEIPWTKGGPVTVSESPKVSPAANMTIIGFSAQLTTFSISGSGTRVVLKKNGTVIAALWVSEGTPYNNIKLNPPVRIIGRKDHYSIAVTDTSDGAEDLSGGIEVAA